MLHKTKENSFNRNVYFVHGVHGPASFDPLYADQFANLTVMRLMYLTPLEISPKNDLASSVLNAFSYDKPVKRITFTVKEDLYFENGEPLTVQDVSLSIARFAFHRPGFPVIRDIKGIKYWINSAEDKRSLLPEGMKVDGQTLSIQLNKDYENPLFRFCLETFSIIPASCIERANFELRCSTPPESGYYKLKSLNDHQASFQRRWRRENAYGSPLPKTLDIIWGDTSSLKQYLTSQDHVIALASTRNVVDTEMDALASQYNISEKPSSRFSALLFNRRSDIFEKDYIRRSFTSTYRQVLVESGHGQSVSGSIFGGAVPGYLENLRAQSNDAFDFTGQSLRWMFPLSEERNLYFRTMMATAKRLGFSHYKPEMVDSWSDVFKAFANDQIDIVGFSSGFWPVDIAGDIAMLLTPGLHPPLRDVSSDPTLRNLIDEALYASSQDSARNLEKLNKYIFYDSTIGVYQHYRRFFVSNQSRFLENIPMAIAIPPAWYGFSGEAED